MVIFRLYEEERKLDILLATSSHCEEKRWLNALISTLHQCKVELRLGPSKSRLFEYEERLFLYSFALFAYATKISK